MKISNENGVTGEDLSTEIINWNELDTRDKLLCDKNLGSTFGRNEAHSK
jgi:hypothetical protein